MQEKLEKGRKLHTHLKSEIRFNKIWTFFQFVILSTRQKFDFRNNLPQNCKFCNTALQDTELLSRKDPSAGQMVYLLGTLLSSMQRNKKEYIPY